MYFGVNYSLGFPNSLTLVTGVDSENYTTADGVGASYCMMSPIITLQRHSDFLSVQLSF